jgi:predicted transcriptional regulator
MHDAGISYTSSMRTIIDLPDGQLRDLAALGARTHQPRAALIRAAVADYLARHRRTAEADAFGLWDSDTPDGLEYQARLRAEW